jgi:hypothetical protein
MNLKLTRAVQLAHGTLLLRVYDQRSYLTIIPDAMGEPVFKREYAYWQADHAEQDFETIRRSVGVSA